MTSIKRFKNQDYKKLVDILKNDGVISVPTDTVYGLCAIVNSKVAFEKLKEVKNRPEEKAFPIMCSSINQIKSIATIDEVSQKIIDHFMPGPITIILNKKKEAISYINNQGSKVNFSVAIRLSTSNVLKNIIEEVGSPVFMTSANVSGMPVCRTTDEIEKSCPTIDGILEGIPSFGISSTIVDCTSKPIKIVRTGPVSRKDIMKVIKEEVIEVNDGSKNNSRN